MNRGKSPAPSLSRLKLVAVFVMFFGPLIFALVWYYGMGAAFAPRSGTNHAPLVAPPVVLEAFTNPRPDGSLVGLDDLQGHWTVVHRLDGNCGEACRTSLYNTRQTRLALGRNTERVRRILLGTDAGMMGEAALEHPDMDLVLRGVGGLGDQLAPVAADNGAGPDDALLVDPLGNVMMLIPASLDPSDLLKDLKKLMKLSKVG